MLCTIFGRLNPSVGTIFGRDSMVPGAGNQNTVRTLSGLASLDHRICYVQHRVFNFDVMHGCVRGRRSSKDRDGEQEEEVMLTSPVLGAT